MDVEVESIKLAAEQAVSQLRAAEKERETSFMAQAGAAEKRLKAVSLAVKTLVQDFSGRMESNLQALQDKGAKQAEDLEKIIQLLEERWSQQFQGQADAAVARLQEEVKASERIVEESKQMASLAEAKLAALSQPTPEEYGRQLAQAFREHAQVMHEPAEMEVKSVKLAAEQAIAQLQAAEQEKETGFIARASAVEERLKGVSSGMEALEGRARALVEDFQGRIEETLQALQAKGARQAEDLEKIAQNLEGRAQQIQEQADASGWAAAGGTERFGSGLGGEQAAFDQLGRCKAGRPEPSCPRAIWPATGAGIPGACAGDA